jgi:Zn-dependent M16 (insulinase) family peptidase
MNNTCKLVKTIEQYNEDCVYFCEPIKNNIMNDGSFIRIIYSNSLFILNGIYLNLNINCISVDKYYNKLKCMFDVSVHKDMLDKLFNIEDGLLKKINIIGKIPQHKINDQLKNGLIKVFSDTSTFEKISNVFLLKIAGIWETDIEYGLTYKFINI